MGETDTDQELVDFEAWVAANVDESDPEYQAGYEKAGRAAVIAELVYTARTQAGLTQAQLAERMGTSSSAVSRLESAGTVPTVTTLARLAEALGLQLSVVLEGDAGRLETALTAPGPERAAP